MYRKPVWRTHLGNSGNLHNSAQQLPAIYLSIPSYKRGQIINCDVLTTEESLGKCNADLGSGMNTKVLFRCGCIITTLFYEGKAFMLNASQMQTLRTFHLCWVRTLLGITRQTSLSISYCCKNCQCHNSNPANLWDHAVLRNLRQRIPNPMIKTPSAWNTREWQSWNWLCSLFNLLTQITLTETCVQHGQGQIPKGIFYGQLSAETSV